MNEIQDEYREYRKLCRVEDDPGVTGLAQLGRNAIERVTQLERVLAERDETIRALNKSLASAYTKLATTCGQAEAAERELAAVREAPTVALLEWPATSWPNVRLVSGAYAESGKQVELIARPSRKGEAACSTPTAPQSPPPPGCSTASGS